MVMWAMKACGPSSCLDLKRKTSLTSLQFSCYSCIHVMKQTNVMISKLQHKRNIIAAQFGCLKGELQLQHSKSHHSRSSSFVTPALCILLHYIQDSPLRSSSSSYSTIFPNIFPSWLTSGAPGILSTYSLAHILYLTSFSQISPFTCTNLLWESHSLLSLWCLLVKIFTPSAWDQH